MKSKFSVVLLVAVAFLIPIASLNARVSLDGSGGWFRIPSAYNLGKGTFTIGSRFMLNYYSFEDSFPTTLVYYDTTWTGPVYTVDTTVRDTIVKTGDALMCVTIPFGMSYAITDFDEFGLTWVFYYDRFIAQHIHIRPDNPGIIESDSLGTFQYFGRNSIVSSSIGDLSLFYKRTIPINEKFTMGGLIQIIFPTGPEREDTFTRRTTPDTIRVSEDDITWNGGIFRTFRQGFGGGVSIIGTFKPIPESPFSFGGVLGYNYLGYNEYQTINVGIGASFKGKYFEPFVEATGTFVLSPDSIASPLRLTPGIRFTSLPGLYLDIAYDFRLTSNDKYNVESYAFSPEWLASVGFGWSYDFIPERPKLAWIAGTVTDSRTMTGIQNAQVTFTDTTVDEFVFPGLATDEFGSWYVSEIPAPRYFEVNVNAEGYSSANPRPVFVYPEDSLTDIDFVLDKEQGMISGIVYEIKSDATTSPIAASINISGDTTLTIDTDENGKFEITLLPGTYTFEAFLTGYIPSRKGFDLASDQVLVTEFNLLKEKAELVFHNINFEVNKADLLPESYTVLNQVARLLKENPDVRIEIQGHTDSDGSNSHNQTLSEARANSVRNYLINTQGISPDKLTAVGYGETRLMITPERSREDKRMNRRVEFHVIEN
ncbi:OmpA family protein [candidate division WOR-3 bacterium]|nr:OmpA family protein [candidate division WOR-3 bacterium]